MVFLLLCSVLYRHTTPEEDPTDVFFDINAVDPSGDTSINKKNFSPNGKWFACGMSKSGSDWMIIKVIDTATKKEGPDCVKECRNSPIAWLMDSSGFLYAVSIIEFEYPSRLNVSKRSPILSALRGCKS